MMRILSNASIHALLLIGTLTSGVTAPISAWCQQQTEASLGRLFHTPEQRNELDRRRQLNIKETVVVVENYYKLNGQVARSSGKTTTWVNGAPRHDEYRGKEPAVIPMNPGDGQDRVNMKVGQTLETSSRSLKDGLNGARISVRRDTRP